MGVVALALSVLFEMLAHHQTTKSGPPPPDPIRRMFGADAGSDISSIASEFLKQVEQDFRCNAVIIVMLIIKVKPTDE